jgi:hypothetical protein
MINIAFVLAGNLQNAPAPTIYVDAARRFAETYKKYPSAYEHKLFLINSNGGYTGEIAAIFDGIDYEMITYNGSGWDIGAQQFAAFSMDPKDWILAGSSWTYFKEPHWLLPFGKAIEQYGEGLYGAMTSFQHSPHVRGTAYLIRCGIYQRYPHGINSRGDSLKWESDPAMSLTRWVLDQGIPAFLVTRSNIIPLLESRKPDNIFRRGDQSNILIFDKHTDIFDNADEAERKILADMADHNIISGQPKSPSVFQVLKNTTVDTLKAKVRPLRRALANLVTKLN